MQLTKIRWVTKIHRTPHTPTSTRGSEGVRGGSERGPSEGGPSEASEGVREWGSEGPGSERQTPPLSKS